MPTKDESLGTIDISPATITTIASEAINQCYGVVGMASRSLADGIARVLSRDNRRGIEVSLLNDEIVIDVYIEVGMLVPNRS